MNRLLFIFLACSLGLLSACENDPDPISYEYHGHIFSPDESDKHIGDTIHIAVEFESHANEPVYHINVRIFNKATNAVVYNAPANPYVNATSGLYEFEDDFILSTANGLFGHSDWIVEAKVWAEDDGEGEVKEEIEFHIEG